MDGSPYVYHDAHPAPPLLAAIHTPSTPAPDIHSRCPDTEVTAAAGVVVIANVGNKAKIRISKLAMIIFTLCDMRNHLSCLIYSCELCHANAEEFMLLSACSQLWTD